MSLAFLTSQIVNCWRRYHSRAEMPRERELKVHSGDTAVGLYPRASGARHGAPHLHAARVM